MRRAAGASWSPAPSTALATFEEALALWRGPALSEFAFAEFAQPEIRRLEELRLETVEGRIEAILRLGRHGAVVAELGTLVEAHPLRERLRGQLMLALYRAGRQAEALEVYREGRTLLSDQLGLEPGTDLQRLERAILEQDPALDAPAEQPREAGDAPPAVVVGAAGHDSSPSQCCWWPSRSRPPRWVTSSWPTDRAQRRQRRRLRSW